jgi:hypothetical protein
MVSCATNPLTGKKTLNFVSNSELFLPLLSMELLKEKKLLPVRLMPRRVEAVEQK